MQHQRYMGTKFELASSSNHSHKHSHRINMSGSTPPRRDGKQKVQKTGVDPGPASNPHTEAKRTQMVQVHQIFRDDWTRWASVAVLQDGKPYDNDNIHAKAVRDQLNSLRTGQGPRSIVLHSAKQFPSNEPNEMYKILPGLWQPHR